MLKSVLRKARELLAPYSILMLYTFLLAMDLGNGCKNIGGKTTVFVYSLMLNDPYYVQLLSLSLVYSFAKIRVYGGYALEARRTAHMSRAILIGFLLSVCSCIVSILGIIPYVSVSNDWGSGIDALSTYAKGRMHYWRIPYDTISTISPALAITEVTCILIAYTVFVSALVERCFTSHIILVVTIMMCFSDFQVINELAMGYAYVFPTSVVRISLTSQSKFIYAMLYLFSLTALLLLLFRKRRDIS